MKIKRRKVVITGMGVLSSIASNTEEFKEVLFNKKCNIKPSKRFQKWFVNANASEIELDLSFPEIKTEIRESLDNAALWAYQVSNEALIQANLKCKTEILNDTAMIVGVSSAGTEAFLPLFEQHIEDFSIQKAILSGGFSSCCSGVSSLLGIRGGTELVATACTASTNAIGMGFDYIQNNKNPVVLVIGTEPIYLPTFAGFYALNVMKEKATSPFSGTPGMSIGEGAGALVLEDYDHAIKRGATIYGEILSYATSCDAYHETGPEPRGNGAVQVMQKALSNAGITPNDINYINVHGTGTEANDRIETISMKKVFPDIHSIPLSSTKSYVGHNIGAAGIVEMIACFLSLAEDKILPTLNYTVPRVACDLNYVPNEFQYGKVNFFMKNNYAFGGNNCSVIASPQLSKREQTTYTPKRVVISGAGAVTSIGNNIAEIFNSINNDIFCNSMSKIYFDEDVKKDIQNLMSVINEDKVFEKKIGHPYFNHEIDHKLKNDSFYHSVKNINPKNILRHYNSRKAVTSGIYALIALNEALEDAGKKINRDGENLGFIVGMSKGPQSTVNKYLQSLIPDPNKVRTSEFPGTLMNAVPTFCAINKGIKGYTTTLATGMNAALGALTYGYEIIRQGLQPQVIVGGADEYFGSISLYFQAMSEKLNLTSDAEDYQVYSTEKKGYIPAEGACMLFLEDMENAINRNATIYAEVIGYGKANDNTFFDDDVSDRINSLSKAIYKALDESKISTYDIDVICGTSNGTKENDEVEIGAINQSFKELSREIPIVNYNAFFGLVESSPGLLAIIMGIEMMKTNKIIPIPYTRNFADIKMNFLKTEVNKKVNNILIIGSSDSCNHYATVIRRPS